MFAPIAKATRRTVLAVGGAGIIGSAWPVAAAPSANAGAAPWRSDSPFLSRAFAPVFDERDDLNLTIDGEIPAGLDANS